MPERDAGPPRGRPDKFTWRAGDFEIIPSPWTLTYAVQVDEWRGAALVQTVEELVIALMQRRPDADPVEALCYFCRHDPLAPHMPATIRAGLIAWGLPVPPPPPEDAF